MCSGSSPSPPGCAAPIPPTRRAKERKAWDHQENISINYSRPIAVFYDLTVGGGVDHVTTAGRDSWSVGPSMNLSVPF